MSKLFAFIFIWLSIVQLIKAQNENPDCLFQDCTCDFRNDNRGVITSVDVECSVESEEFPKRIDVSYKFPLDMFQISNQPGLKAIPDDRFNGLTVGLLDLTNNGFETIAEGAFNGIAGTTDLVLTGNKIKDLDEKTLKPLASSLVNLHLNKNKLGMAADSATSLSAAIGQLSKLNQLSLNENQLKTVPNLSNNKHLQMLDIEENDILTLNPPSGVSHLLPDSLQMVNLQNNRLTSIEANWFSHLKNVRIIELAKNLITTIDENAFKDLRSLKKIDLSRNDIKYIPSKLFLNLPALKIVHLGEQRTAISKIGSYAFDKNTQDLSFETIDLSSNNIDTIEPQAFCSYQQARAISVDSLSLQFATNANLDQLACPLYQIENKVKLELKNVKCGCGIHLLATKFDLVGDCLNENQKLVPMKDYKCSNKTAVDSLCSNPIYDCSKQQQTPAPTTKISGGSDGGSHVNGKATEKPMDPVSPARPVSKSTNLVSNNSFILLLISLSIIFNLVLNNNDRFN